MIENAKTFTLTPESAHFVLWAFDLTEHLYRTLEKEVGIATTTLQVMLSGALYNVLEFGPSRFDDSAEKKTLLFLMKTTCDMASTVAGQPGHAYHDAARQALSQLSALERALQSCAVDKRRHRESSAQAPETSRLSAELPLVPAREALALASELSGMVREHLSHLTRDLCPSTPPNRN